MRAWQRRGRWLAATIAIASVIAVAFQFKRRPAEVEVPVVRPDPKVVVEFTAGVSSRTTLKLKDGSVSYAKAWQYEDGSMKMFAVRIETERDRKFVVTAKETVVGKGESTYKLSGDVRAEASDGLIVRTESATYTDADGILKADERITFSRGRMSGSAVGMVYNKVTDVLSLLAQVTITMGPEKGREALEMSAGTAEFNRPEKAIHFSNRMSARRPSETMEADAAVARLSPDEQQVQAMELRGNSNIKGSRSGAGALRQLSGTDIDLTYAEDGIALQRAVVRGGGRLLVAGAPRAPALGAAGRGRGRVSPGEAANREVAANVLDISLAPDGATPTNVIGNEGVQLTIPAENGGSARTIAAQTMEAKGDERRGLTSARFTGRVEFRERGPNASRVAHSAILEATLAPGLSTIEQARFLRDVRFEQDKLTATADDGLYLLDRGTLSLRSDAGREPPHLWDEQIDVNAKEIDVTLDGPSLRAVGAVKSELLPRKAATNGGKPDGKVPSMFKQNQPVSVNARELTYDGKASKATYSGDARMFQAQSDTTIKGSEIVIDGKTGDLTASGGVTTVATLFREGKDKKREPERSEGSAKEFRYVDGARQARYVGNARLKGPQGDVRAATIDLFLKASGDEIDRAVADDEVTLVVEKTKATGKHLEYFSVDDRYELKGSPVELVDERACVTTGKFLKYFRTAGTMSLDGSNPARTETRSGGTSCS